MIGVVIVIIALVSPAVYGAVANGYINAKIGFVFLMVPLASWVFIGMAVAMMFLATARHRRRKPA